MEEEQLEEYEIRSGGDCLLCGHVGFDPVHISHLLKGRVVYCTGCDARWRLADSFPVRLEFLGFRGKR